VPPRPVRRGSSRGRGGTRPSRPLRRAGRGARHRARFVGDPLAAGVEPGPPTCRTEPGGARATAPGSSGSSRGRGGTRPSHLSHRAGRGACHRARFVGILPRPGWNPALPPVAPSREGRVPPRPVRRGSSRGRGGTRPSRPLHRTGCGALHRARFVGILSRPGWNPALPPVAPSREGRVPPRPVRRGSSRGRGGTRPSHPLHRTGRGACHRARFVGDPLAAGVEPGPPTCCAEPGGARATAPGSSGILLRPGWNPALPPIAPSREGRVPPRPVRRDPLAAGVEPGPPAGNRYGRRGRPRPAGEDRNIILSAIAIRCRAPRTASAPADRRP